jgi:hypothetical protein
MAETMPPAYPRANPEPAPYQAQCAALKVCTTDRLYNLSKRSDSDGYKHSRIIADARSLDQSDVRRSGSGSN